MSQKRKNRGRKFNPKPMARPSILDTIPNPDEWQSVASTEEQVQAMKEKETEGEAVKSQAAALIETQRKSVEVLTFVKDQVQGLDRGDIVESLQVPVQSESKSAPLFKVIDNFLKDTSDGDSDSDHSISREMLQESISMFDDDQMDLDLQAGLCSGEYATAIKGGQDQYADCPRVTEFVVSLTRHLTGLLNNSIEKGDNDNDNETTSDATADEKNVPLLEYTLDETASMAGLRTFNRKARLSSIALLTGKTVDEIENDRESQKGVNQERQFGYVTDNKSEEDEVDYRKITALYFLTPEGWDASCGGGVTVRNNNSNSSTNDDEEAEETFLDAQNDRLVIMSSDACLHRMEEWIGGDNGRDNGSVVVTHFVQKRG